MHVLRLRELKEVEDVFIWFLNECTGEGFSSWWKAVSSQLFHSITKFQINQGLQCLHFERKKEGAI